MVRISRERMNMEDGRIDRAILKDHAEIAIGSSTTVFTGVDGTYTIDVEAGNTYNLILNANCSFTFSNPTGSGNLCSFTLILTQDQVGNRTVTWPGAVSWMSAVAPTLASGSGDYDVFSFMTLDGGTKWFGSVAERDHLNGVGELWSWGFGTSGQLGSNAIISRSSPVQVGIENNWTKLQAGDSHTVALKPDGTLWSWGDNTSGRVGNNSTLSRSSPTQIGSLTDWTQISGGGSHSLAIRSNGTLWAWGGAFYGPLGINNVIDRSSPTQVGALTTWSQVSAGSSISCAIKTDGTLWAWGFNGGGYLGNNNVIHRSSPIQVGALTTWSQVSVCNAHVVAIKKDGSLWSWGFGGNGRTGHNNLIHRSSPTQIGSLTTWSQAFAGSAQAIALKNDGTIWTWGQGTSGTLGHNDGLSRSSPTQVGSLTNWAQVFMGITGSRCFAIKTDGTLWAWGSGTSGPLGLGNSANVSSPTQVGTLTSWEHVSTGSSTTFALQFP